MNSQTFNISCPKCGKAFPLSETLAKPIIAAERAKAQQEVETLVQ